MMLHNIQKQFLEALFNSNANPDILSSINESESRNAIEQLNSYRDSVIGGINEALAISYPVVKKLIGDDFFNYLTQHYIQQTPSTSPDLNNYGHDFCNFLQTCKNLESVPYLPDVARLEWCWQKIINGSKTEAGNLQLLANLTENESDLIIFKLSPHANLLHSPYAIQKIWEMNQDNVISDTALNIDNSVNLLVWRNELAMNITVIDKNQFYFLSLINQLKPFSEVCELYIARFPDDKITILLSNAIQSNWIHSFSLNP